MTDLKELKVSTCPLCGDPLTSMDGREICRCCASRSRNRAFSLLLDEWILPYIKTSPLPDLPVLGFSMDKMEYGLVTKLDKSIQSASLYGSYRDGHQSGVDVRHMPGYKDGAFSFIYSCLLFDYFPEHEDALRECFRVLAPGGIFVTHISPLRLSRDGVPIIRGSIRGSKGNFEYLGEKEMPDVSVGKAWFLRIMDDIGFRSLLSTIEDPSGLPSDWFIGVKPAKAKKVPAIHSLLQNSRNLAKKLGIKLQLLPPGRTAPNIKAQISETYRTLLNLGNSKFGSVIFEFLSLKDRNLFYLYDAELKGRHEILAKCSDYTLLASHDLGATWHEICQDIKWDSPVVQAFPLLDGGRLIRTQEGAIYHFNMCNELISSHITSPGINWHGSQGIGQSSSGIVMYGENPNQRGKSVPVKVLRYNPAEPDKGWEVVLSLDGGMLPPMGHLRHFHVCSPIGEKKDIWLLSSGDGPDHCHLWLSGDDGGSFREYSLHDVKALNMPSVFPQPFRFTQFGEMANGDLIWGCDDILDSHKAALYSYNVNSSELRFIDWLDCERIRNCVSLGKNRFLMFSEGAFFTDEVQAFYIDMDRKWKMEFKLPCFSKKSGFTFSLGSLKTFQGKFFLPAYSGILAPYGKTGIFRIRVKLS